MQTTLRLAWWYSPLAVVSGLLPWIGGIIVPVLTKNLLWLLIVGVLITAIAAAGAHVCRKAADPASAKPWLIAEPFLYACYYGFAVVIMRYVFLR